MTNTTDTSNGDSDGNKDSIQIRTMTLEGEAAAELMGASRRYQGTRVSVYSGRTALMEHLASDIPTNEFGLPVGIYRMDLLPEEPSKEELRNAFVPLSYHEGFPSLPTGDPLWACLPHEPPEAFQLFDAYLRLPSVVSGVRSVHTLRARATELAIPQHLVEGEKVFLYYFGYFWDFRVRAYDLWMEASRRKTQERRAIETLDTHYFQADTLLKRLMKYLEDEEEFWDLMTPKVAIDFFNKLITVQRISAGLSAAGSGVRGQGNLVGSNEGEGTSVEILFRNLAQQNADARDGVTIDQSTEAMQQVLDDPATAQLAQELIIKLNGVNVGDHNG